MPELHRHHQQLGGRDQLGEVGGAQPAVVAPGLLVRPERHPGVGQALVQGLERRLVGGRSALGGPGRDRRQPAEVLEHPGGPPPQSRRRSRLGGVDGGQGDGGGVHHHPERGQPVLPGLPGAEHGQHRVGGVGVEHLVAPPLPFGEGRRHPLGAPVGEAGLQERDRRGGLVREVVEGQELELPPAVGAVQGGQVADHQGHGDQAHERLDEDQQAGQAAGGHQVAEADGEEPDPGEVDRVEVVVDAGDRRAESPPDEPPARDQQHHPHDQQAQQRQGPVDAQERLAHLRPGPPPDGPPGAPGQAVVRRGRPVPGAPSPGRDQGADGVAGGHEHQSEPGQHGQDLDDAKGVQVAARFGGQSDFVNVPHLRRTLR